MKPLDKSEIWENQMKDLYVSASEKEQQVDFSTIKPGNWEAEMIAASKEESAGSRPNQCLTEESVDKHKSGVPSTCLLTHPKPRSSASN